MQLLQFAGFADFSFVLIPRAKSGIHVPSYRSDDAVCVLFSYESIQFSDIVPGDAVKIGRRIVEMCLRLVSGRDLADRPIWRSQEWIHCDAACWAARRHTMGERGSSAPLFAR